jgi:DNA-binding transcriptional LysR family regulator
VEDEIARGELVRIPVRELRVHRKLRLVYRKSAALSHAGRAFLKIAESIVDTQGGRYRFERSK